MKKTAVIDQVAHAATHPLSTAAYVFGVARGVGAEVIRTVAGQRGPSDEPTAPAAKAPTPVQPIEVPRTAAAPQVAPTPPAESFATEPTAVTRTSAHGGGGNDAEIDDWRGDVELDLDPDADPATGSVVEALERGDRPGDDQVDHGAVKSVLSEAERFRPTE